jgi:hypothetical protein
MSTDTNCNTRPIPGFPGYHANVDGDIITQKSEPHRALAKRLHRGHLVVTVQCYGKRYTSTKMRVDQLVLLAFAGPRPTPLHTPKHLNGNKTDTRPSNLTWARRSHQMPSRSAASSLSLCAHLRRIVRELEHVIAILRCESESAEPSEPTSVTEHSGDSVSPR